MAGFSTPQRAAPRGFTLIEVLVVIVVIGVAAVSLITLSMRGSTQSAQALHEQQTHALAVALLDEAESMPFTYCDPTDPLAATATSAAGCTKPEVVGPEAGEVRLSATPLNNVNDYNGLVLAGGTLRDVANQLLSTNLVQLTNCTARFTVQPIALGAITVASGDALHVSVLVQCPDYNVQSQVDGIRVRYAPNQYKY